MGQSLLIEGARNLAANAEELAAFKKRFGHEPTPVVVAFDALAIYVHRDNPIEGLTLQPPPTRLPLPSKPAQ